MNNKTFRLFVSSTFNDFIDEREIINSEIVHSINKFCSEHGYEFQVVDLRWGVTTESALNQKTISICLDEVKRCREFSPKPNFLMMVGERYGWIPLCPIIDKGDFEKILSRCDGTEAAVLQEWYILDENKIGGEYYLKARCGEYEDETLWGNKEEELRRIILKYAENCGFTDEQLLKFTASATEQEIIEGIFTDAKLSDNAIAVFRKGYSTEADNLERIDLLKERISSYFVKNDLIDNILHLDYDEGYNERFKESVESVLKKLISDEIKRLENLNITENEQTDRLIESKRALFVGRENEKKQILKYTASDKSEGVMWVVGESGSGKSSIIAQVIDKDEANYFYNFFGADDKSYTLIDAVSGIVKKINKAYDAFITDNINSENLSEIFEKTIRSVPENKKAIIIFDGFETYYDIKNFHENIFPEQVPANVKIIISSADENLVDEFMRDSDKKLTLNTLSSVESRCLLEQMLERKGRCIANCRQREEINRITEDGCYPLKIWVLAECCSGWHSADEPQPFPDSIDETVWLYIESMFKNLGHNRELVLSALSLVAASPFGIGEDEVQKLLLRFQKVKEYFVAEDRYSYQSDIMPIVVWSRLFYDFSAFFRIVNIKGYFVIKFAHQIVQRVIEKYCADYYDEAVRIMSEYYTSSANFFDSNKKMPNVKKVYSLIPLLDKIDDCDKITDLVLDMDFVDACIKADNLQLLLNSYVKLIKLSDKSDIFYRMQELYSCLQKHREMLECYRDSFFFCAINEGIVEDESSSIINLIKEDKKTKGRLFFPYNVNACVKWSDSCERYAVCQGNTIRIISALNQSEISKINNVWSSSSIASGGLIWVDEKRLAVAIYKTISFYDVSFEIPKLLKKIELENNLENLQISHRYNLLLLTSGRNIIAIDLETYDEKYSVTGVIIDAKKPFIDEENNLIGTQVPYRRVLSYYRLDTGESIKTIKLPYKKKELSNLVENGNCFLLANGKIFLWGEEGLRIQVIDLKKKRIEYLHLPDMKKIKSFVVGKRYVVLVYQNMLINIDMSQDLYPVSVYENSGITDASWYKEDETLSLLCKDGLYLVNIADFVCSETEKGCYVAQKCITNTAKNTFSVLKSQIIGLIKGIFSASSYSYFSDYGLKNWFFVDNLLQNSDVISADMVCTAVDGKMAVAYEVFDYVEIYNENGEPVYILDKLNLSVKDSIIRMQFSHNSRYLLLWRLGAAVVIDTEKGKRALDINLKKRPALDVNFSSDDSCLELTLCNEINYSVPLTDNYRKKTPEILPGKLVDEDDGADEADYSPAYVSYSKNGEQKVYSWIKNNFDSDAKTYEYSSCNRIYATDKRRIELTDGNFWLVDSDKREKFRQGNSDFMSAMYKERQKSLSLPEQFVFEKNDVMSKLFDYGRYMVLVCCALSSIIVFDTQSMEVMTAYKHHGKIIGFSTEGNEILLHSDNYPYQTKMKIKAFIME